ncbi:aldehyde dehydrogenase family protein [Nocardioides nitrophenolicus]|uniref:aldehyde dehydrogenase family protein n=1 Tax=Nocardioides nitrophenolicus TaxID=60489 RepID=UPI001956F041|nr:aldehyde dehydrogenase family protein [Nocardioides nitrophenolicus]MBM7516548.1 acyl-CoA reductase-like NAD-dependent aldehyde dehydrogenase [Nocardioides nitrophenolicus]
MADQPTGPVTAPAQAGHMLERARWAARAFATYSPGDVERIVRAVAEVAHANAQKYAEWAVRETGFGVVEHKVRKNQACSRGLLDTYAGQDFVSPRIRVDDKIVEVPRPAGVVLALTPSTNPVATVFFKVILSLMTRNAVVVSPHPMAQECCHDAAQLLARAAVEAGAPDGIVQSVAEPTIPLVEALMGDARTNVILATGGTGVVRSAYSSGNPAIGVGPGNVPVLVDATADVRAAARRLVESKAFDNSVLCTNESVLVVEDAVADRLLREMERAGAAVLGADDAQRLRDYMFPYGRLNVDVVGKDASWIAQQAGIRVGPRTQVLVAPFDVAVPEEPLTHEKLSPVLGLIRVPDAATGIATARAIVRIAGAGHSAAIHSTDPATVMRYAADVPVLRVSVNVGNSTGSSGLDTNLAPTMTIGTGFVGRSALSENLQPKHLVDWTRIAYDADPAEAMPSYAGLSPWADHRSPVPAYPLASNDDRAPAAVQVDALIDRIGARTTASGGSADDAAFREQVRRLVVEELSHLIKG